MTYDQFLTNVIRTSREAALVDYAARPALRDAALEGLTRCAGKGPLELQALYEAANHEATEALRDQPLDTTAYWTRRVLAVEIEWVCNVVSAWLLTKGATPLYPWMPSARGVLACAAATGFIANRPVSRNREPLSGLSCGCDPGADHVCAACAGI